MREGSERVQRIRPDAYIVIIRFMFKFNLFVLTSTLASEIREILSARVLNDKLKPVVLKPFLLGPNKNVTKWSMLNFD